MSLYAREMPPGAPAIVAKKGRLCLSAKNEAHYSRRHNLTKNTPQQGTSTPSHPNAKQAAVFLLTTGEAWRSAHTQKESKPLKWKASNDSANGKKQTANLQPESLLHPGTCSRASDTCK